MSATTYEKVLFFKEIITKIKQEYKDYSTYELFAIAQYNKLNKRGIIKSIFFKIRFSKEKAHYDIYTTNYIYKLNRKDHINSQKNIINLLKPKYDILEDDVTKFSFDYYFLFNLISGLYLIFKLNKYLSNYRAAINLSFYIIKIEKNKKILKARLEKLKPKVVLLFCDILEIENELCIVAKSLKIKTVTLQHGQYYYYDLKDLPIHSITLNQTISDYFLSWGKYTVKQAKKYGKLTERFINVGSLKNLNSLGDTEFYKMKNSKIIGVILDTNDWKESNINMIKLINNYCSKYGYSYILRLHPTNSFDDYRKFIDSKSMKGYYQNISEKEYLELIDFSICHLSSLVIELMKYNHKTYIYIDRFSNIDLEIPELEFRTETELFENLKREFNLQEIYSKFIEKPEKTKENYLQAFEKIISS